MELWLTFNNNQEKLQLPIPPATFEMSTGLNNTVVNVNDIGEINLIGKRKLKAISFDTFFPNQVYSFCQYSGFPEPYECIDLIEKWRDSGKPIRLIITTTGINIACSIEDFKYRTQDGTGDVYFNLSLKEYRFLNVPTEEIPQTESSKIGEAREISNPIIKKSSSKTVPKDLKKRTVVNTIPKEYLVMQNNETLVKISKKVYGIDTKALAIAEKNGMSKTFVSPAGIEISTIYKPLEVGMLLELVE